MDVTGNEPQAIDGDDDSAAVLRTVGKVIKMWRERAALKQSELGAAIGYSEEQVSSVERGRRAPRRQFLEAADQELGAGGMIAGLARDVEEARYPKKVRDLAKLEGEAVEICAYGNTVVHGLLQTEAYARPVRNAPTTVHGGRDGAAGCRSTGTPGDLRSAAATHLQFRPGRGDPAPPARRQNGDAQAARTPPGSRPIAER